jgi:arsenate reductase-like glutaredoxin family protein
MTCGRTQEYLASHHVASAVQVDARKHKLGPEEALALTADVDEIYSAKGKKVVYVNLKKDKPDRDALAALLLGPSGTLRAPALRKGRTLLIGFDAETYASVFG